MQYTAITHIGDPQILVYGGKYYVYATSSREGFLVWQSEDLRHFSSPVLCFRALESWGMSHFWAPEVVYHGGKFIMHYTAKSRALGSLRIGVAVADSPLGPFVDVHGAPMFDFGYAAIDGSVLLSDAGNYLYYARDCSENVIDGVHVSQIWCVPLDETLTRVVGEPRLMTTPTEDYECRSMTEDRPYLWNEGPCVLRVGERYVMNYSANFYATNDYAICMATADHPLGPWRKSRANPVLSCRADLFGAGHNAFFRALDGTLCTAFHIQTNPDHPSGDRRIVIGRVKFTETDGDLVQTIE